MKKKSFIVIWLMVPFCIFSCVNLKSVSNFSATSTASISNFENLDYTFSDHCKDRCEDEAVRKFELSRALECSCDLYSKADSVTRVLYQTINGYFVGLGNLAQNELTNYSANAAVNAMTASEFGPLKIDENLVGAYSAISNTLLRATTDFYRKRKIAAYIGEANGPIQVLLDKFQIIILSNLKGELRFKRERLYVYYMDMKMNRTLLSDYEKGKATRDYYQALDDIQLKEKQMDVFAQGLQEIGRGHQALYENRDKLSVKNLALTMLDYSAQVEVLISEFNQLNH
ncbi:hypothetical protein GCM10009119_12110 [Algoriphagus jejuensis]|uniref:PilJ/NarX-like methyl-accepting chemotaxis transducer n=1 Tax=Algoriphagus jejuensis TaxID=419934 RepID=A0ABP3YCA1_9BACT